MARGPETRLEPDTVGGDAHADTRREVPELCRHEGVRAGEEVIEGDDRQPIFVVQPSGADVRVVVSRDAPGGHDRRALRIAIYAPRRRVDAVAQGHGVPGRGPRDAEVLGGAVHEGERRHLDEEEHRPGSPAIEPCLRRSREEDRVEKGTTRRDWGPRDRRRCEGLDGLRLAADASPGRFRLLRVETPQRPEEGREEDASVESQQPRT